MLNIFWKYWNSKICGMCGCNNPLSQFIKGAWLIMICGWLLLLVQSASATPPLDPRFGSGHRDDVAPMHHRVPGAEGRLLAPGDGGIGGTVYTTGTVTVIALLVEFSDVKFAKNRAYFEGLMNDFAEYYQKNSYGKLEIVWAIATSTVTNTMSYYGYKDDDTLIEDAVNATDGAVDFSKYQALMVVHAGQGEESSRSDADIHSQFMYSSTGIVQTSDRVAVYGACIMPEHEGNASPFGIFCHEFGHQLGLPDLYDTGLDSEGIGEWSEMAAGAWNGSPIQGSCPSYFDAWCKMKLDWLQPQAVTTTLIHQSIPQAETNPVAYKLWNNTMDTREYFLVENRQSNNLPGKGLLIWHIDERQQTNDDKFHYKVALEQADGRQDLENKFNRGDAGDPYPGNTGNRCFNGLSNPNSRTYSGNSTYISVTNISDSAGTMSVDLSVIPTTVELMSPENGTVCSTNIITFRWTPLSGTASYSLIINGVGTISCGSAATYATAANKFAENAGYMWQVMSVSEYGTNTSNTWHFWINAVNEPPSQPVLLSPCNQVISQQTPTFRWQASTDPDPEDKVSYVLQYSKQSNFVPCTESETLTANSYTTPQSLDDDYNYYWRVRATDKTGNSTWSGTATFTISMITWSGGTITAQDGITTVIFPEGAVSDMVSMVILLPDELETGVRQTINAATNVSIATDTIRQIEITNGQIVFDKPVTIRLPYSGTITQAIYRLTTDGKWERLNSSMNTASQTVQAQVYSFAVFGVGAATDYVPTTSFISSLVNYPNPFIGREGDSTLIRYVLKEAADVSIRIYNPIGEIVWNAQFSANSNGGRQGGDNMINWYGKNGHGEAVSQGIYFCVVEANGSREIRKIGVK
ncbi:M6 family metalloprotease domain-containing protein [bacterium]|nr:M6 family metalloprotease domain-containing protein [bacterium]